MSTTILVPIIIFISIAATAKRNEHKCEEHQSVKREYPKGPNGPNQPKPGTIHPA